MGSLHWLLCSAYELLGVVLCSSGVAQGLAVRSKVVLYHYYLKV